MNRYVVYKLYYWKMFNLIVLVVVDITSKVLFNSLVESFYLFIYLKVKSYRKFVVHSEFCYKYCKESKGKGYTSIYDKFVWQSIIINDLSNYSVYEIFCWIGFINKNKLIIFNKTFYNDEDIVIAGIIDRVFRFI